MVEGGDALAYCPRLVTTRNARNGSDFVHLVLCGQGIQKPGKCNKDSLIWIGLGWPGQAGQEISPGTKSRQ